MFASYLPSQGLQARGGQKIATTLVYGREVKKEIKANRLPDGWNESPMRLQRKDLDARWDKK